MRLSMVTVLLFAVGCGGRTFVAADGSESDAAELPGDAQHAPSHAIEASFDAGSPAVDASDAGADVVDAAHTYGPMCMYGSCDKLGVDGMTTQCGTWCCNTECDAPKVSLCAKGQCGEGNSNITCAYSTGDTLCCSNDSVCP